MKLETIRKSYYSATSRITEMVQSGAIGGIVAVWAIGEQKLSVLHDPMLRTALLSFVAALLLNFFHMAARAQWFGFFSREGEKQRKIDFPDEPRDGDYEYRDLPVWGNQLFIFFVYVKCATLLIGLGVLAVRILD